MKSKLYNYQVSLTRPMGLGSDDDGDPADFNVAAGNLDWCPDSDGIGREPTNIRPEGVLPGRNPLPHGTMIRRLGAKLDEAHIKNIICHTIPPHPDSELGQFMGMRCYADRAWPQKRTAHWSECNPALLNGGSEQVWDCDGTYEQAIQEIMQTHNIVTATSINALAQTLMQQGNIDHPILSKLPELYPEIGGRRGDDSMDIWNPAIVDVLELAYKGLFGPGRRIKGLWMTLGGGFIWSEVTHYGRGDYYQLRTQQAQAVFHRTKLINMNWEQAYGARITTKLCEIATELVSRLKPLCKHFYFHVYFTPPDQLKPEYLAAGMVGLARKLCEALSTIEGCHFHLINSHAWDCSPRAHQEAIDLQALYPDIEFIAGVGWGKRLKTNGVKFLADGYKSIEVGLQDREQWHNIKECAEHIRKHHEVE